MQDFVSFVTSFFVRSFGLTQTQAEVVAFVAYGLSNAAVAEEMSDLPSHPAGVTEKTVKNHLVSAYKALTPALGGEIHRDARLNPRATLARFATRLYTEALCDGNA